MLSLALLAGAALACTEPCACRAHDTSATVSRAYRAARKLAVSLESSMVDAELLDAVQRELGETVAAVSGLHAGCAPPIPVAGGLCERNTSAPKGRRVCACRLPRLFNLTVAIHRQLDDAALGVLMGDSEQSMELLTSTTMPYVLHGTSRVVLGLDALGRHCGSAALAPRRGGMATRHIAAANGKSSARSGT